MAIPNPNPNIADGVKCDNKTYSSNKIESLISATEAITIDYAITVSQGDVSAYRYGNVIVVSGYFKIAADESSQVSIIELSGITIPAEIFTSTVSSAGTPLRLKLGTNGKLINESTIKGNEYYGFTLVVIAS